MGPRDPEGKKPITIMAESMHSSSIAAGRHGAGTVSESLHLVHNREAESKQTGNGVGF